MVLNILYIFDITMYVSYLALCYIVLPAGTPTLVLPKDASQHLQDLSKYWLNISSDHSTEAFESDK